MRRMTWVVVFLLLSVSATLAQDGSGRLSPGAGRDVREGDSSPITDFRDASFEDSAAGAWSMGSDNFGSPLCTIASCGTGAGTAGPKTGNTWLWFGGTSGNETAFAQQVVVLPQTLDLGMTFEFYVGAYDAGDTFTLEIQVDGVTVRTLIPVAVPGWNIVYANLTDYADGEAHTIRFQYSQVASPTNINVSVDDITLIKGTNWLEDHEFEVAVEGTWSEINSSNDKRRCNTDSKTFSYTGLCAYVFTGGTTGVAKLRQVYLAPLRALPEFDQRAPSGTLVYSGAFVRTTGAGKGKLILKVTLSDSTVQKIKATLQSVGVYDWQQTDVITFSSALTATKITTTFQITSTSGKMMIDEAETVEQYYYVTR